MAKVFALKGGRLIGITLPRAGNLTPIRLRLMITNEEGQQDLSVQDVKELAKELRNWLRTVKTEDAEMIEVSVLPRND